MRITPHLRCSVRATVAAVLIFGILGISHLAVNHVFAAGLGVDKLVSAHASGGTSVTTAAFSTAQSGELLVEEAPMAYKDVEDVAKACEGAGLSRRVARLRPVAVIKG